MKRKNKHVNYARIAIFMALSILCAGVSGARAEIFKYRDASGAVYYTDSAHALERYRRQGRKAETAAFASRRYDAIISEAARKHQISFPLLKALIRVESNFNARAVSPKGAKGLMQLMPLTLKQLNISNPFNPYENVMGGSKHLKDLMETFGGDVVLTLAAYNAGIGAVQKHNGIPPYQETTRYIESIIKFKKIYSSM